MRHIHEKALFLRLTSIKKIVPAAPAKLLSDNRSLFMQRRTGILSCNFAISLLFPVVSHFLIIKMHYDYTIGIKPQRQTVSVRIRQLSIFAFMLEKLFISMEYLLSPRQRSRFIRLYKTAQILDYCLKYTDSVQSVQAIFSGSYTQQNHFCYA